MRLANRGVCLTRMPKLIERLQILGGHVRHVRVGDAFPPFAVRTVDQGAPIRDAEGLFMVAELFLDVAELDVAVQTPSHAHELIAGLHRAGGVRDEHADTGEGTGKNKPLQRLEEFFVLVDLGFEIRGQYGQCVMRLSGDVDDGIEDLLASREDSPCSLGFSLNVAE